MVHQVVLGSPGTSWSWPLPPGNPSSSVCVCVSSAWRRRLHIGCEDGLVTAELPWQRTEDMDTYLNIINSGQHFQKHGAALCHLPFPIGHLPTPITRTVAWPPCATVLARPVRLTRSVPGPVTGLHRLRTGPHRLRTGLHRPCTRPGSASCLRLSAGDSREACKAAGARRCPHRCSAPSPRLLGAGGRRMLSSGQCDPECTAFLFLHLGVLPRDLRVGFQTS